MAKTKSAPTYRVRLTSPRTTVGGWSRDLVQGETFTEDLPEDVLAALTAGENPLIEEVESEDADG